jgi:hypothetical protein
MAAFDRCDGDVGVVSCCLATVGPDGEVLRAERSKPTGDIWPEILEENVVGSPSRTVVRRTCLDDIGGFDESLEAKHDWDLSIRLSRKWRFETLQEVLCYRTVHDGGLSADPERAARAFAAVREKHESTMRAHGCWDAAVANNHTTVGIVYLFRGERRAGRNHLGRALRRDPSPVRAALYASTFVPGAFGAMVDLKRWVERATDDRIRVESDAVPGTDEHGRPVEKREIHQVERI